MKGLRWAVKNGESMKLWMDFWLPSGRLREFVEGPLSREEEKLTVKQCFDENHVWNPRSISFELLERVINTIKANPFSYDQHSVDILICHSSGCGRPKPLLL